MNLRHFMALAVSSAALVAALPALSAEYAPPTAVDAVTVFASEATVERVGTVTISEGEHILKVVGLPAGLDANSVRITAQAPFKVEIGSVDIRRVQSSPMPVEARGATEQKINDLEGEKSALGDRRSVFEARMRFIEGFSKSAGDGIARGLGDGKADLKSVREVMALAFEEGSTTTEEIRKISSRVRAIDIDLARLRQQLKAPQGVQPASTEASVNVASAGAGPLTFRIEYRVADARWTPVYEARLATGGTNEAAALELVTRAAISQTTGEDWTDAAVTLSTSRPSRGASAGQLPTIVAQLLTFEKLMLARPVPAVTAMPAPKAAAAAEAAPADDTDEASLRARADTRPAPVVAVEQQAEAEVNGLAVVYKLPGRVKVPSSPEVKTLKVTSETVEPALSSRVVPKVSTTAYLSATFKKGGEAGLLPGAVSLFRDGVFIGQGNIAQTAAGDQVKLGFGEDPRVKVDYAPLKQTEGETGSKDQFKTARRDMKISVKNLGTTVRAVTVEENMPVAENTDIRVDALGTNAPQPSQTNLDGRRGVVGWVFDLKPGEARDIRFGWQVRWPSDKQIRWMNQAK